MRLRALLSCIVLAAGLATPVAAADAPVLVAPGRGVVRAVVIGIDGYHGVNQLKGAAADARDIDASLRSMGAADLTTLIDDQADRASVLKALEGLVARANKGDLVMISLAGHGSKEDERVKGSSPDGTDEVFLLVGFDPKTGPGGAEKILNHEFNHYIRAIEERGAQVVFVADTCYGGGLAREIAPGSVGISYRQVPRYRLAQDDLKPVSTTAEALMTKLDFTNTTFLAAVDSETKAPEVLINGRYRGALSYAMARAVQGAADEGDGKTTLRELFAYVRKVVYQLSDERQTIVAQESPLRSLDGDAVFEFGGDKSKLAASKALVSTTTTTVAPMPLTVGTTAIRFDALPGISPLQTPFKVVGADANPDILWDPVSKEAIAAGDKIALNVERADLPGVIDRTAAVRDIKDLVVRQPQGMRLLPDASLHRSGSRVEVEVSDTARRSLILVDIAGNGTVQFIYPTARSPQMVDRGSLRVPFQVRDPFGADQVVAITSEQRMSDLEDALRTMNGRKSAGLLAGLLRRFAPADARIGIVGLFTVP